MQFFAQRFQRHFKILDERIGFVLAVESVFVRVLNRVLGAIVNLTQRGCQVGALQLGESVGDEHGLHELLGHAHVEKRARLFSAAHLDDAALLVEFHIGETAHGYRQRGILAPLRGGDDDVGDADEFFSTARYFLLVFCAMFFPSCHAWPGRLFKSQRHLRAVLGF